MKKFFSKALSLVLTLALLATIFSFIGVTASAASTIVETPENNAKKVYLIDFTNAPGGQQGEVIAYIPANYLPEGTCKDAEIEISYSYYLKSEHYVTAINEIYARNWYLGNSSDNADVPDDETGLSYLKEGMGSFFATYTCPTDGFLYGVSKENRTTPTNADLYIWDLEVYINGELVDTNPIKDNQNRSANVDVSVVSYEEMFNAQKAWKCTFNNVQNGKGGFALTPVFGCGKNSVKIEFDYYYYSTSSYIYFKNATGENFDTVTHDGSVVDMNLQLGTHHLVAESASFPSANFAARFQNGAGTLNGTLYIWNINLYLNGVKRNDKITPLNSYSTPSNATNGYIVEEGTYGEIMGTRKAYVLDYAPVAAAGKTDGNWLSYINASNSTEFQIAFNYKVVGAVTSDAVYAQSIGNGANLVATAGDTVGSDTLNCDGKEHFYEYKDVLGISAFAIRLNIRSNKENTNVKVYIWDLIVRRTDYQYDMPYIGQGTLAQPHTEITYADVVDATPVMALDFAGAESVYEDNQVKSAKYQLSGNQHGGDESDISISFEYYLANAADDEISVVNVAGGDMSDDKTGTSFLQPGRHSFTINRKFSTFSGGGYNILVAVGLAKAGIETNAKLYIWNLTCTRIKEDGTVTNFGGYNKGIFNADTTPYVGPEASMVERADIDNDFDANNDGDTNVLDLIRAKRVSLNPYLAYDKENLGYVAINAETLVNMKKAMLA